MADRSTRNAVVGFFAGVVTVLAIVLVWSMWNRSQEARRVDLPTIAPPVPELPAPRLPDAPLIPDAPVPTPK